ncbi:MAG: hypothetical protein NPIRA06_25020 [Nitrospirales bacterium]|nr:MAG: hypothetical protein NPIRA06_25020 [Nitrospirales bacterium]
MLFKRDRRITATGRSQENRKIFVTQLAKGKEQFGKNWGGSKVHSVFLDNPLDRKHDRITIEIKIGDV